MGANRSNEKRSQNRHEGRNQPERMCLDEIIGEGTKLLGRGKTKKVGSVLRSRPNRRGSATNKSQTVRKRFGDEYQGKTHLHLPQEETFGLWRPSRGGGDGTRLGKRKKKGTERVFHKKSLQNISEKGDSFRDRTAIELNNNTCSRKLTNRLPD